MRWIFSTGMWVTLWWVLESHLWLRDNLWCGLGTLVFSGLRWVFLKRDVRRSWVPGVNWFDMPFVLVSLFLFFFFLSFCYFLGRSHGIWRFPGHGSNRSRSHRPTPEPQQCGIRAASATYTTAPGNARSLTHWARAGIEPTTSWFLVGFVNHCATMGSTWISSFISFLLDSTC